ncbi:MAG: immunity 26/phosphotriesterase HocA family protein [Campylobacteraceae bacterium]|jgi:hypothetical protein|nr:immunity 26/phosphotriesterase HocA family protein [Campylobacteraceae bacterium]
MSKRKFKEGDFFAISINKSEDERIKFNPPYAFGRLIAILPSRNQIVEFFNYYGDMTNNTDMLLQSGRLFNPISTAVGLYSERWTVIKSDPLFQREDAKFSEIKLGKYSEEFPHLSQIWIGGKTYPAKKEDYKNVEPYIIYAPQQVEERIRNILKTG